MKKKTNAAAQPALWGFAMLFICFLGPTTKPVLRMKASDQTRESSGVSEWLSAGFAPGLRRGRAEPTALTRQ